MEPPSASTRTSQSNPNKSSYEEIMGMAEPSSDTKVGRGASSLGSRLIRFREWLTGEAKAVVHPSVCIVNGEATDGTKNAPVLIFGPPPSATTASSSTGAAAATGRCGMVDRDLDQALYDRTIGCQVRVVREMKKDEVMMTIPRSTFVTPDVVASSDAGTAVLACCEPLKDSAQGFWDAFENTTVCEKRFADKVTRNSGTQLLVKILQERKKAELVMTKSVQELNDGQYKLARHGTISTRAPVLAFLIHQRFSNDASPPVTSKFTDGAVSSSCHQLKQPPGCPSTFSPYVRTLPSAVPLPLCWKRNELALLAGCIPGVPLLQEVAAQTFQLASEFIALAEAGISHRFPDTFPQGLITWERWVWAASVFASRVLPVSCYLNKGEETAANHIKSSEAEFQSPSEVWDELGVMIPLLDMLNHESETSQVTWEPCVPTGAGDGNGSNVSSKETQSEEAKFSTSHHPPQAVVHKRVKKGSQLYCSYGTLSNQNLILQYGFAQINNAADEVRIGWGLMDAVGNVPCPGDYISGNNCEENEADGKAGRQDDQRGLVYESSDPPSINRWWSEDRLAILEKEALLSNSFMSMLKSGKKMTAVAYSDGTYHPIFLTAAVIGTLPPKELEKYASKEPTEHRTGISLTRKHQKILREYLAFVFTRKLEKLLQSLNNSLKDHFNSVQLWTKVSQGGLQYAGVGMDTDNLSCTGWQAFFDSHAYTATMELEKRYYAVGPDCCVLALYDGHLRSLQASIDGVSSEEKFESTIVRQLEELGFVLLKDESEGNGSVDHGGGSRANNGKGQQICKDEEQSIASGGKGGSGEKSNKRRNRKKGDRPPATKLHIGNLAYTTNPANLFEFFAGMYGRENILECHIPTERDSGRSRGFGFVTMPEAVALKALQSGRKHEIDGRLLKVAESNSAGAGKTNRVTVAPVAAAPSDRCASCGYRPRYCTCANPKIPAFNGNSGTYGGSMSHGPPADVVDHGNVYGRNGAEQDYYASSGGRRRDSRSRRSYSRSSSPHHGSSRYGYGRGPHRAHRDSRYGRSRSRSYSRERDRERDRSRRERGDARERDRSRDSRSSGRRSSRGSGVSRGWGRSLSPRRSRSADRSRSRSYSDAPQSRRDRDRKSVDAGGSERPVGPRMRGLSRSASPQSRGTLGSDRKREGQTRKRSRSRSRGRSRRKRRRQARSRSRSDSHSRGMRKE